MRVVSIRAGTLRRGLCGCRSILLVVGTGGGCPAAAAQALRFGFGSGVEQVPVPFDFTLGRLSEGTQGCVRYRF